jgi:probable HAF family extracellular repeat protein
MQRQEIRFPGARIAPGSPTADWREGGTMKRSLMLLSVFVASRAFAAPSYVAVPLGALGGPGSAGNAINASGQATGWAMTTDQRTHAFRFANGAIQDLGVLGSGAASYGMAINVHGEVAGYGNVTAALGLDTGYFHGFVSIDGSLIDIGNLGGTGSTEALGINDAGVATGWSTVAGDTAEHAFIYDGTMRDIGTLPGGSDSQGFAIDGAGHVVGWSSVPSSDPSLPHQHAFYYDGAMHDLGSLAGPAGDSNAYAISGAGAITGISSFPGDPSGAVMHAFLYTGGTMRDLGSLPAPYVGSVGYGIDSAADVVGTASTSGGGSTRAFLYSGGVMYDLNDLVVSGLGTATLTEARSINDTRQIIATGCGAIAATCQAFRLDPVPANPDTPVAKAAIEYHYAQFDHYFMTADSGEIASLDAGAFPGWQRTGQAFNVYLVPTVGAEQVCRFFNDSFAPQSSHFYSADPNECLYVMSRQDWAWQFEGITMYIPTPDAQGNCAGGTQPVYRLYNNGMGGAPNHRYTASLVTRNQMIGQGWVSEGYGSNGVIMCAPL